jgi:NAD(P)-dependent dehydrogenase (short-subunit alcohol dehydrogenase family)
MTLGLEGRKAIVTGGSKGLGRAIAQGLAKAGCHVAICARNEDEVQLAGKELQEVAPTVFARTADVTDPEQVRDFIAQAAEALGGIDILVNNAGRARPGTFATLTDQDWKEDLDVKLFSMIRCSREVLPHMRAAGGGRIININAVQAKSPDPKFFATSVNRAACLAFTKTLSIELAPDNILVNGVNVGFIETPQWENIHQRRAPDLSREEFFEKMAGDEIPLGRFGQPQEVSPLVTFLASDMAGYITGASIDVAGGMGRFLS